MHCTLADTRTRSRRTLEQMGASSIGASLSFIEADLSADLGWDDAAAGSSYVLHVASPFAVGQKDGNIDTIGIARSGTLRVLRAAHEAKVKRLVITSSCHELRSRYGHR